MYRSPLLNKAVIPVLAVGSLAYAVYATAVMRPVHETVAPLAPPPERPFPRAVAAVGIVEPASELVAAAPRVAGSISTVHVAAGQRVKAGDPLFTLDDTDLRAELALRREAERVAAARLDRLRAMPRPEDVPIARAALDEALARLEDARLRLGTIEAVTDRGAVSDDERNQRRQAVARAQAEAAERRSELDKLLAGAWKEDLAVAESERAMARAAAARTEADIDRLTTRAPIDAVVLRLTARAGQYAPAGVLEEPLATLGSDGPLHIRADVTEHDIPRVRSGAAAVAMPRGDAGEKIRLRFVRVEPLVTPKRALSGFAQERVDTRVMQVIFAVETPDAALLVGQQVDVFIDEAGGA
ncbi:MAG: efflux RND transporter periplasmic adaptor subunit [Phycisphaerales bacterium]|nr:efflux RND transporter periplasmic adaptor subunit [Phycisphaerales bacterium]